MADLNPGTTTQTEGGYLLSSSRETDRKGGQRKKKMNCHSALPWSHSPSNVNANLDPFSNRTNQVQPPSATFFSRLGNSTSFAWLRLPYHIGPIGVPQPFNTVHGEWGPPISKTSDIDWEIYSVWLICCDVLISLAWVSKKCMRFLFRYVCSSKRGD